MEIRDPQLNRKCCKEEDCPCGSGRQFKDCCLQTSHRTHSKSTRTHGLDPDFFRAHVRKARIRRDNFGDVRAAIHANYRGHKIVAIGDEVICSKKWRTFLDFLDDYIKHVLDPSWGKDQLSKPLKNRHQIMKMYDGMCKFQQKCRTGPDGLFGFVPNGPTRAYLLLAYDLYTLRHHMALQTVVVKRLKHKDQFQGARHELFAAATCIRAGYDIDFEDESDNSRRHVEFTATHRATGQEIAVEAKSRHRSGILERPGKVQSAKTVRAEITGLLRRALQKPVSRPYVIFVDLNLPSSERNLLNTRWFSEIARSVADLGDPAGDRDRFNLIVLSNQPDHYLHPDVASLGGSLLSVFGRDPCMPSSHPTAIAAIHHAADTYGTIPNTFEQAG